MLLLLLRMVNDRCQPKKTGRSAPNVGQQCFCGKLGSCFGNPLAARVQKRVYSGRHYGTFDSSRAGTLQFDQKLTKISNLANHGLLLPPAPAVSVLVLCEYFVQGRWSPPPCGTKHSAKLCTAASNRRASFPFHSCSIVVIAHAPSFSTPQVNDLQPAVSLPPPPPPPFLFFSIDFSLSPLVLFVRPTTLEFVSTLVCTEELSHTQRCFVYLWIFFFMARIFRTNFVLGSLIAIFIFHDANHQLNFTSLGNLRWCGVRWTRLAIMALGDRWRTIMATEFDNLGWPEQNRFAE